MFYNFSFLVVFLSVFSFCIADNAQYHIIPLSSAGETFDLKKNNPYGPNSKGQTINKVESWFEDPEAGRISFSLVESPNLLSDNGHVLFSSPWNWYIWSLESGFFQIIPPSGRCYLKAINNHGEVAFDDYFRKGYYHAHILTRNKKMISLGTLGGLVSSCRSINDYSQIVGRSEYSGAWWEYHAFIWDEKSGMRDLNHLIPQDSGWSELTEANFISNDGLIEGIGLYQGQPLEFLLIPVEH